MILKDWIWKPIIAGSCGTVVHLLFMYFRTRSGLLPSFQPYQSFQLALSQWVGANVPRDCSVGAFVRERYDDFGISCLRGLIACSPVEMVQ